MHTVDFYFDYLSPYAWLALVDAGAFAAEHDVAFVARPVVYGVLLDVCGLVGPAESEFKRRYTFVDVARLAQARGLQFEGPPSHPFRSLEALRLTVSLQGDARALPLAVALARACWERGRDLTDVAVLAEVAGEVGIDPTEVPVRVADPAARMRLRTETESALAAGVFGVPSFRFGEQLFWGQDRMWMLAEAFDRTGAIKVVPAILDRPRGIDRRRAP